MKRKRYLDLRMIRVIELLDDKNKNLEEVRNCMDDLLCTNYNKKVHKKKTRLWCAAEMEDKSSN